MWQCDMFCQWLRIQHRRWWWLKGKPKIDSRWLPVSVAGHPRSTYFHICPLLNVKKHVSFASKMHPFQCPTPFPPLESGNFSHFFFAIFRHVVAIPRVVVAGANKGETERLRPRPFQHLPSHLPWNHLPATSYHPNHLPNHLPNHHPKHHPKHHHHTSPNLAAYWLL